MPRELILMAIVLLFGAWMVLDSRSLSEKLGIVVLVLVVYVIFQYLSGDSLLEIFNSMYQFVSGQTPPPPPSVE